MVMFMVIIFHNAKSRHILKRLIIYLITSDKMSRRFYGDGMK